MRPSPTGVNFRRRSGVKIGRRLTSKLLNMPGTRLNRSRGRGGERQLREVGRPGPTRGPGPVSKSWGSQTPCETGAFAMSDKPISPLRQRMIDDMTARRFTEDTQRDYVRNVRNFTAFLGRSPDTATREDLRRFQLHMARQQISPGSINAAIAALRFFFNVTLERPDLVRTLRTVTEPRKAPIVLSPEEVA